MWLLVLGLVACSPRQQVVESAPLRPTPLPQDPKIQVYFNQQLTTSYREPYRQQTRPGEDLEARIVELIETAQSTIDVAVQEMRLPKIAQALARGRQRGVKVRVVVENLYNQLWSRYSVADVAKLSEREQEKYREFQKLADTNHDGTLTEAERRQADALAVLTGAGVPVIDDTADGSKGTGLMHHKFVVVDGTSVIVTSANFTTSDVHGDFKTPDSRGNPNNLLRVESPALAQLFTEEFNLLWGDGPGGKLDSQFGTKKRFRPARSLQIGNSRVTVQFSPASKTIPWEQSANGAIGQVLATATQSVDLALFVFSAQRLVNTLETRSQAGVSVRTLIDSDFAYRPYSEALDMMGVTLPDNCQVEADNRPWQQPIATVGVPMLLPGDRLHHKFGVIDGKTVITGSHNWTEAANATNDETVLIIENPTVATHFVREFERLYVGAELGVPVRIQQKIQAQLKVCKLVQQVQRPEAQISKPEAGKLINLNTAGKPELETLPGVGPKLAEKIIQARQQQRFTSLEDVARVPGVGPKLLQRWQGRVTW